MRMRGYGLTRLLQHSHRDVSSDTRKVIEELVEGLSTFKIIKQVLHGYARTCEHRLTALYPRIDGDQTLVHWLMIRCQWCAGPNEDQADSCNRRLRRTEPRTIERGVSA